MVEQYFHFLRQLRGIEENFTFLTFKCKFISKYSAHPSPEEILDSPMSVPVVDYPKMNASCHLWNVLARNILIVLLLCRTQGSEEQKPVINKEYGRLVCYAL
jgi:hypothetical protein